MEINATEADFFPENLDRADPSISTPNMINKVEDVCGPTLNSLPEYELLHLLSYLNTADLYNVGRCSSRLNAICSDRKFWREVYDICDGSSPLHFRLRRYLNESTTSLHLSQSPGITSKQAGVCGNSCYKNDFLKSLRSLMNLRTFILENHELDYYESLNFMNLPANLTQLILNRVNLLHVAEENKIFNDIHNSLPNLEVVDVSQCSWVTPDLLLPLSRCLNLKKLVMINCSNMRNITFYADLATDSGFSKLKKCQLKIRLLDMGEAASDMLGTMRHVAKEKYENPETDEYPFVLIANARNCIAHHELVTRDTVDPDVAIKKMAENFKKFRKTWRS